MAAVGIDLGNTFSCVAVYSHGRPDVIKCQGHRTTPSTVFYHDKKPHISVGHDAQDEAPWCLKNEIFDVKRIIGRKYEDCYVQKLIKSGLYPFSIIRGDQAEACIQIEFDGKQILKSPESICSELLVVLKKAATDYLGQEVTEAVISVPAYFSSAQRSATRRAAELSNLNVLKFISEPVAAALQYTYNVTKSGTLLVFDFGGGTLDVSVIKLKEKKYEVKAVNGDTALGGRDIDNNLINHFKSAFGCAPDSKFERRLKANCIKLKKKFSLPRTPSAKVEQVFFYNDKEYSLRMSREKFDALNKNLFDRTIDVVETCLFKADLKKTDIDEIILVGGSCKILKVQEMLQGYFKGKKLYKDVDPDEATALGACIQAAVIKQEDRELEHYKIMEVTPLSLGVDSYGGIMVVLIPKNSPLPASNTRHYATSVNDQTGITFHIYEGERSQCRYNNKLGILNIDGLPKEKAGKVSFEVTFNLDENGILEIIAKEKSKSLTERLVISVQNFHLGEYQINKNLKEELRNKSEDEIFCKFITKRNELIFRCNNIVYDSRKIENIEDQHILQKECNMFILFAESTDFHDIDELMASFHKLCDKISSKIKRYSKTHY